MRKLCLIAALLLLTQMFSVVYADTKKIGDDIGDVLSTDIIAQIDEVTIPSFNINNSMAVKVSDLKNYGFDVSWDEQKREVHIKRNGAKEIKPLDAGSRNTAAVGAKLGDVLYTDIKTYMGDREVKSFNMNGSTLVHFRELKDFGTVTWDEVRKLAALALAEVEVKFEDISLEKCVREEIKKPAGKLIKKDVARISSLYVYGMKIKSLKGIEYLHSLSYLNASNNEISDLSPLEGLVNLTSLDLSNNSVRDIKPLAAMTKLKYLYFINNKVKDISVLSNMTELRGLYLRGNIVFDYSALDGYYNKLSSKDFYYLQHDFPLEKQLMGENAVSLVEALKPGERVRLFPDSIKSYYQGSPGSIRDLSYDGGRYIALEYSDDICLYDLQSRSLSPVLGEGRSVKLSGNHAAWYKHSNGKNEVYLLNIEDNDLKDITAPGYSMIDPVFSPDGKYISVIAFGESSETSLGDYLFIYSVEQGKYVYKATRNSDYFTSCWTEDGYVFTTLDGAYEFKLELVCYDPARGKTAKIDTAAISITGASYMRASGSLIVYENSSDGIHLYNMKTMEHKLILDDPVPMKTEVIDGTIYKYSEFRLAKVYFPEIDGTNVVWTSGGDFYCYDIKTGKTSLLADFSDKRYYDSDFDTRYFARSSLVKDDIVIFYGFDFPTEILKLK